MKLKIVGFLLIGMACVVVIFVAILRYYDFDTDETIVAVIDTGVDYHHAALKGKVILGFDFVGLDFDPMDEDGHGTHVAGIILAQEPTAKILAVRLIDKEKPFVFNATLPILYSIIRGSDVINMSYTGENNFITQWLIDIGTKKGITFVASSGNAGKQSIDFPARYQGVYAIAAYNETSKLLYEGNNVDTELDYVTPGVNINSTDLKNTLKSRTGTSMAAAHFSGIIAHYKTLAVDSIGELEKRLEEDSLPLLGISDYKAIGMEAVKAAETKELYLWMQPSLKRGQASLEIFVNTRNADEVSVTLDGMPLLQKKGDVEQELKVEMNQGIHTIELQAKKGEVGKTQKMQVVVDTEKPLIIAQWNQSEEESGLVLKVEDMTLKKVTLTLNKKSITYREELKGKAVFLPIVATDFPLHIRAEDIYGQTSEASYQSIEMLH